MQNIHYNHIAGCAAENRNQHLSFPDMKQSCDNDAGKLGHTIGTGCKAHIFKAIYYEHAEDGRRLFLTDMNVISITAMAGMTKCPGPNTTRQTTEITTPATEAV